MYAACSFSPSSSIYIFCCIKTFPTVVKLLITKDTFIGKHLPEANTAMAGLYNHCEHLSTESNHIN